MSKETNKEVETNLNEQQKKAIAIAINAIIAYDNGTRITLKDSKNIIEAMNILKPLIEK